MKTTNGKKSILPYIFLILGIVTLIAITSVLIDGFDDYKREISKYVYMRHKSITESWSFVPEHPEFIHGNNNELALNISLALSFIGMLYLCFNKSAKAFKLYRMSLCIYILCLLISAGSMIAHCTVGTSDNMQNFGQVPYKTEKDKTSLANSNNVVDEEVPVDEYVQETETVNICPLASNLGVGRAHWFFNANKNYYIAFQFISESRAQIALPNGDNIACYFDYHNKERGDAYIFESESEDKGSFSLREGGTYLRYRIDPSDIFETATYAGTAQASNSSYINQSGYSAPDNGSLSTTSSSQKKCSLCGGKGWIVGNKTPVYEMGEMYCSECGGFFPNSHSHEPCPSCQERGYVNF